MSLLRVSSTTSASPLMLLASALFHGIALVAVIVVSAAVLAPSRPIEIAVTHVKLVEAPRGTPVGETIGPDPESAAEITSPQEVAHMETVAEPQPARHRVDRRTSSVVEPQIIPLKKRKTEPKSVSSQSQEKPKQEKVTKKEDPKTFLEKRLAAIRDNVNKKKSAESETGHAMGGSPNSGVSGQHQGSGITDLETARWFDIVRQRVNSQWSVFSDNRNVRSVTVIGVKISDSGELVNPTVDESSGDYVFDKSALRAVSRAAPFLPPVPEQVRVKIRQSGGLALRFTPSGMQ